tara:strand:- start:1788 stop:3473 length:1686 start_codon:yes stop_codon:yes gene_type:complete
MADAQAVSGVRKQLLQRQRISAQRGIREPTRPERYRRGKVSNSGANLQAPRPDPTAGMAETENAKLIAQMQEFVFGKGMVMDQYGQAEKERGIASWEKADAETRESYEKAIKNGWIDSKESPFFREAVTNAYTDNLTHIASVKLFTDYEKWPDRNDPSSGKLDEFFQQQEDEISAQMESIPDETLQNRFYEQWQVQKRELARRHTTHLNANYQAKSEDEIGNKFYNMINQNEEILGNTFKDNNLPLNQILQSQKLTETDFQEAQDMLSSVKKDGTLPSSVMKDLEQKAMTKGGIWEQMYKGLSDKPLPTDVLTSITEPSRYRSDNFGAFRPSEPFRLRDKIREITPEEAEIVGVGLRSDGSLVNITKNEMGDIRDNQAKRFLDSQIGKGGVTPNESPVETFTKFNNIIAPAQNKKANDQNQNLKEREAEPIIKMAEALKNNDNKAIQSEINKDKNTVTLGDNTKTGAKGLIAKGGGAYDTLPKFIGLAENYSEPTKAFAKSFQTLPIQEQRKLFTNYLKDNYTGGKGFRKIWNPKKMHFVGKWKEAKFNFAHFQTYVESKS